MNKLEELLKVIDQGVNELDFNGQPKKLYDPMRYILGLGGKRIRPALVLAAYKLFQSDLNKEVVDLALLVEMFHNFTLLHDDIMDGSPLRRGEPTVHVKWDEPTAILAGDLLQILVYKKLHGLDNTSVSSAFDHMAIELCEGQMMDMNFEDEGEVDNTDYLEMIRKKTAVLLAFSLYSGAKLANSTEEQAQKLYELGIHLGVSFQLMDDYLDTFGEHAKVGKRIGGDILEQKKTFLWNEMYKALDQQQRTQLSIWKAELSEETYIKKVSELMRDTQADIKTLALAEEHHKAALNLVSTLDHSNDIDYLNEILVLLDQRKH